MDASELRSVAKVAFLPLARLRRAQKVAESRPEPVIEQRPLHLLSPQEMQGLVRDAFPRTV